MGKFPLSIFNPTTETSPLKIPTVTIFGFYVEYYLVVWWLKLAGCMVAEMRADWKVTAAASRKVAVGSSGYDGLSGSKTAAGVIIKTHKSEN